MNLYTLIYFFIINIIALIIFGIDKIKAKNNSYRISEATLLCACILGGSFGGLLGMYIFHHKTRKLKFQILVPVFLLLNIIEIICLLGIN